MRASLTTFSELASKEVICTSNGRRLGYVSDLQIEEGCARVLALLLPDRRLLCFSGKARYRVAVEWIDRIGEDLILVKRYECLQPSHKGERSGECC